MTFVPQTFKLYNHTDISAYILRAGAEKLVLEFCTQQENFPQQITKVKKKKAHIIVCEMKNPFLGGRSQTTFTRRGR